MTIQVNVTIPEVAGAVKQWARLLDAVDPNQKNGYAFIGNFLKIGRTHVIDENRLILHYREDANGTKAADVLCVNGAATNGTNVTAVVATGPKWAETIRDALLVNKMVPEGVATVAPRAGRRGWRGRGQSAPQPAVSSTPAEDTLRANNEALAKGLSQMIDKKKNIENLLDGLMGAVEGLFKTINKTPEEIENDMTRPVAHRTLAATYRLVKQMRPQFAT